MCLNVCVSQCSTVTKNPSEGGHFALPTISVSSTFLHSGLARWGPLTPRSTCSVRRAFEAPTSHRGHQAVPPARAQAELSAQYDIYVVFY